MCWSPCGLVRVSSDARRMGIRVAVMTSCGPVNPPGEPLVPEIEKLLEEVRSKYSLDTLRNDPVVKAYRKFYWQIGIDPTKTRPSSEALVRRALRGKWPRIMPLVDAGNIASARFMVPIGLYDMDTFTAPAEIVLSRGGEKFYPIGGGEEVLPKGIPILVDSNGIVMHLYPHRDSSLTKISITTSRMLSIAAGVPGVGDDKLAGALRELRRLLQLIGWESSDIVITG